MKIKVIFGPSSNVYTGPLNKKVNGFINRILGENNKYHGVFSRYNVSSMQGGSMNRNGELTFNAGGYIYVSSDDSEFMDNIINGLLIHGNGSSIEDMRYVRFDISDFGVNEKFDLVRTISPINIRFKNKPVTFNDDNFCSRLLETSKKKLIRCGYDEKDVNTLAIELFHKENARTKMVEIGGAKIICNKVMLVVKGKKNIRKALYEIGLGMCTGFGFGSVTVNNNNKI